MRRSTAGLFRAGWLSSESRPKRLKLAGRFVPKAVIRHGKKRALNVRRVGRKSCVGGRVLTEGLGIKRRMNELGLLITVHLVSVASKTALQLVVLREKLWV